jgi:protein-disulfide isomerase
MAPVRGSATASVVLLVFSDLSCTTCAGLEPALKAIRDEFPKDVQIVFKHNPPPDDAKARLAHEAAVEAGRQGKFWEMRD